MAASALLPGYTLWRLKKRRRQGRQRAGNKKKKKDEKSTFSYLRPLTPPSLTCLTPICCHPHSNVFHHNVLCKSQDDSSRGGSEGQEVTAGGGTPDIHLSERPPFYPPCTLSLLLMYQSEKLHTAEAPARRHLAAGETRRAKLESEPSLVLKDNVTEIRLLLRLHLMKSFNQIECLRKDNNIQSNSCYCKWNIFSFYRQFKQSLVRS